MVHRIQENKCRVMLRLRPPHSDNKTIERSMYNMSLQCQFSNMGILANTRNTQGHLVSLSLFDMIVYIW